MTDLSLTPEQQQKLALLARDLPSFARSALKITQKDGSQVPFVLNKAQMYIHSRLEAQKKRTGRVRAVILKGRQQGCSTYTQARFFHQIIFKQNLSAFILAHQAESTLRIYQMVRSFYGSLPPFFQYPLLKDTERALQLDNGSAYSVGTAGSAQVGRGFTIQLFHGSEVGFYENADELSVGIMQAVADVPGTELILESTANGPGNFFYNRCMAALGKKDDFELIFVPWFWQDEYTTIPLKETDLTEQERNIYEAHKENGLTLAHMAWRRKKISEFDGREWKFTQEYPNTAPEAFVRAEARFFSLEKIYKAKSRKLTVDPYAPFVVGVDQGRTGDPTVICRRMGRKVMPFEEIPSDDGRERDMRLAGRLANIIDNENPDLVIIDTTNEHGVLDRLHELGYKTVKGVHFGMGAIESDMYRNIRAEMYFKGKAFFDEDVQIPDDDEFISELAAMPDYKETSSNLKYLEGKDKIREELKRSPNKADSWAATFAYPVRKKYVQDAREGLRRKSVAKHSTTLNTLKGVRRGI